jgi:glucan-binding YG repeat protein
VYVEPYQYSYCGQDVIDKANEIWNGYITIQVVSSSSAAHAVIKYGGEMYQGNPNIAAATSVRVDDEAIYWDGTLKRNGLATIECYDAYHLDSAKNNSLRTVERRGHAIAHEIGHVFGLADVYNRDEVIGWPNTSDALMGDGCWTVTTAGRPDISGVHIVKHNPWYRESINQWKYWDTPGVFKTGWQWLKDGNGLYYWFYFLPGGIMSTNSWHTDSTSRAYVDVNGRAYVSSWQKIGGYWYCFDGSGHPYTNCWRPDSYTRGYVGSDGRALTGWQWLKDTNGSYYWFYMDPGSASMLKNVWRSDSTSRAYLGPDGRAYVSCWQKIDSYWYCFDDSGHPYTNCWRPDSTSWAYVGSDGHALTGWQWLKDGNGLYYWFYFDLSSASMFKNRTQDDSGGTCYLKADGRAARNEWVRIGNYRCEVDANYHLTGMIRAV